VSGVLDTLRQPRYLGFFAITIVIAALCWLAGSWQIARFNQKRDADDLYRANNRAPIVAVAAVLGSAKPSSQLANLGLTDRQRDAHKFRRVSATGTYVASDQSLLRGQTINNNVGYLVITPLQTSSGVLFVARGFIDQNNAADTSPKSIPAPPSGVVTVAVRLQPASVTRDRYGSLPGVQVDTVNVAEQAARMNAPAWNGYGELLDAQPGLGSLTAIPLPDMSNPAGGAEVPQHAAYVVQWYIFGALALTGPFFFARSERNRSVGGDPVITTEKVRKPSLDDRLAGRA
jgi:cytochrome oxidase assembly protein ShyY1